MFKTRRRKAITAGLGVLVLAIAAAITSVRNSLQQDAVKFMGKRA